MGAIPVFAIFSVMEVEEENSDRKILQDRRKDFHPSIQILYKDL